MTTKLNNSLAVATLTAICMMSGIARGDEGSDDYFAVSANVAGDGSSPAQPLTCQEQREAAWFLHELSRTDGENDPQAPAVNCRADVYAESTAISD